MKRVLFSVLSIGSAMSLLVGCGKEIDSVVEETQLTTSVSEIEISAEGESKSFKISSNAQWTITGAKGWLDVDPKSGEGDKVVVVSVDNNDTFKERECTLMIMTDDNSVTAEVVVVQDATEAVLEVDVDNIVLSSKKESTSSFRIKASGKWTIEGKTDWLDLSSTAGSGEVAVTVTAVTTNYSDAERKTTLVISSEGMSKEVIVSQKPEWLVNCVSKPTGLVIMANGAGFGWEFTDEVAYYYRAELEKSVADRMTTMEIVDYLLENGQRDTPGDNYISCTNYLYPETEYVLYTVSFNEDGVQGVLYSQNFVTKSDYNQPEAYISNITTDYLYWYWDTTIGAYAKSYYMWVSEYEPYMNLMDGLVAYIVKNDIDANPKIYTKILQSGSWSYEMEGYSVMIVTWGVGADDELSGCISRSEASLFDDYSVKEMSVSGKKNSLSFEEYNQVISSLKRIY